MPTLNRIEQRIPLGGPLTLVVRLKPELGGLDALKERARETAPFFNEAGQILRRSFAENFRAGGRPPWAALKPATVKAKERAMKTGAIPRKTPTGKIPPRLMQRDRQTGTLGFGPATILIATGRLRDSWAVKGAKGNVEDVGKESAYYGSQYTIDAKGEMTLARVRPYHVLTKKGAGLLAKQGGYRGGKGTRGAQVPLAVIHELGLGRVPARPTGIAQEEDQKALGEAALRWLLG